MDMAADIDFDASQSRKLQLVMQPFALAVSQSAIPTLMADLTLEDLPIVFANESFHRLTGWTESEVLGLNLHALPADPTVADRVVESAAKGEVVSIEAVLKRKNGAPFTAVLDIAPTFDPHGRPSMLFVTCFDVSDRVEALDGLRESKRRLEERVAEQTTTLVSELERAELLSREITHRTKNALAILSAILSLKGRRAKDAQEAALLADIAGRVRAIGGLQSLLDGVRTEKDGIRLSAFLARLVGDLDQSVEARVVLAEAPDADLRAETTLCLALCVTELVLNAQKHGFSTDRTGTISVSARVEGGTCALVVEDDGVGIDDGFDPAASDGLGMQVLLDQVSKLGGEISCGRCATGGARFGITFPL